MGLIQDIQAAATTQDADLATLLRKVLVLSARLGSSELKTWASRELDGYGDEDELPPFRLVKTTVRGTLVSPASRVRNVAIATSALPEELRRTLAVVRMQPGVAGLRRMAATDQLSLHLPLSAEVTQLLSMQYEDYVTCVDAYRLLPVQAIVGALDSIKTRVLVFALELEAANPSAGEAAPGDQPIPRDVVHQKFETIILGDNATVNTGSGTQVRIETVTRGDLGSLSEAVRRAGVPEEEVTALVKAVEADRADGEKSGMGRRVGEWLEKIGTSAAGGVLAKAIATFYGLA